MIFHKRTNLIIRDHGSSKHHDDTDDKHLMRADSTRIDFSFIKLWQLFCENFPRGSQRIIPWSYIMYDNDTREISTILLLCKNIWIISQRGRIWKLYIFVPNYNPRKRFLSFKTSVLAEFSILNWNFVVLVLKTLKRWNCTLLDNKLRVSLNHSETPACVWE